MRLYFPQKNGTLFFFGRDVNINWKHGVNALSQREQDDVAARAGCPPGRISIILWGLADNCVEEEGSPPMTDGGKGGKGGKGKGGKGGKGKGGREVCNDFKKGGCSRGNGCRYAHDER